MEEKALCGFSCQTSPAKERAKESRDAEQGRRRMESFGIREPEATLPNGDGPGKRRGGASGGTRRRAAPHKLGRTAFRATSDAAPSRRARSGEYPFRASGACSQSLNGCSTRMLRHRNVSPT